MRPAKKMRRCVGVGGGSPPNRAPPHHVLAPTHCWGQRNATNKEKNMHHLLPAPCTPPNIYPANDDDNYSDGGDGDSDDKMH